MPMSGGFVTTGTVSHISDSRIRESSGLGLGHTGVLWTVCDESMSPQVFGIDLPTGKTVSTVDLKGAGKFSDSESVSIDVAGNVCIADIGDNNNKRHNCGIGVFADPGKGFHGSVQAKRYPIVYSDGPKNAEALLIHPITGRYLIISKQKVGRIYLFPEKMLVTRPNIGHPYKVKMPAYVTDGTFSPDGRFAYIRAKKQQYLYIYDAVSWKLLKKIRCPRTTQGESVTVEVGGKSVIIGSEGKNSPLIRVDLPSAFWPKTQ